MSVSPIVSSAIFIAFPAMPDAYITDINTYKRKIEETFRWGGDQLLLQGGHHPELGLSFMSTCSGN